METGLLLTVYRNS